jgi:hypothetical protein
MPLYVDPGAGSLLVQLALSAILGVVFFFHRAVSNAWRSLRDALSRLRRRSRMPSRPSVVEEEPVSPTDHGPRS